jgi:hypothetical protein
MWQKVTYLLKKLAFSISQKKEKKKDNDIYVLYTTRFIQNNVRKKNFEIIP